MKSRYLDNIKHIIIQAAKEATEVKRRFRRRRLLIWTKDVKEVVAQKQRAYL